mgnify:CR=1 FL=1
MLLDVLSGLDEVKICTAYELDGRKIQSPPSTIASLSRCTPVYETLPGWKEDITQIREFDQLPQNAKNYVARIEEITGVPVGMISVGPDRTQTIIKDKNLNNF